MNLESQQKWFHDFWTFTQVTKIPQSLLQKLNYKVFLKSLKQENRFPGVAQLRGPRAHARGPRGTTHGRGSPCAGKQAETTPNSTENNPRPTLLFLLSALLH
jgi:hypothetical protein